MTAVTIFSTPAHPDSTPGNQHKTPRHHDSAKHVDPAVQVPHELPGSRREPVARRAAATGSGAGLLDDAGRLVHVVVYESAV